MTERRAPQSGITKVEIDLGSGSKAYTRWKKLDALMPLVKQALRDRGQASQARVLSDWQRGFGYRVDRLGVGWTLTMDGGEWSALSLGLRHVIPEGRSMYWWFDKHSEKTSP